MSLRVAFIAALSARPTATTAAAACRSSCRSIQSSGSPLTAVCSARTTLHRSRTHQAASYAIWTAGNKSDSNKSYEKASETTTVKSENPTVAESKIDAGASDNAVVPDGGTAKGQLYTADGKPIGDDGKVIEDTSEDTERRVPAKEEKLSRPEREKREIEQLDEKQKAEAEIIARRVPKFGSSKVYLPSFKIVMIRNEKLPPNYAQFIVPLNFGKLDLRDYLYHVYGVTCLSVRSYVQYVPAVKDVRSDRFQSPLKHQQLHRPRQIKKMIIQMADPFVWPDAPTDLTKWDKDLYERVEKHRDKQRNQSELVRKTLPDESYRKRIAKELASKKVKDAKKEKIKEKIENRKKEAEAKKEVKEEAVS